MDYKMETNLKGGNDLSDLLLAIRSLDSGSELLQVVDALIDSLLKRDCDGLEAQRQMFDLLHERAAEGDEILRFIFLKWISRSQNCFALTYKAGFRGGRNHANQSRVRQAANGRKLIGSATRERVRASAKNYMHLAKDEAAHVIAADIGKSSGRVRKLLVELFPGDEWGAG